MNKVTLSVFAAVIVIAALVVPAAAQSAAPAAPRLIARTIDLGNGKICKIAADGTQVCYGPGTDPQYTDPTYSCPEGSTPIVGDPSHCLVISSGFVYADRPTIPATYKCPEGYVEFEGGPKACRQVLVAGYYQPGTQPIVDYTCPTVTWTDTETETKKGVTTTTTYTITFTYEKSSDPHKCHRPSDASLGSLGSPAFSTWPGKVNGKFRSGNPEFLDSSPIYGDCASLGTGWETDPAVVHGCRLWIPTTYNYADKIVDVAAHPGNCPEGYDPTPGSDTQCRKLATTNDTINANVTAGTPYCTEGTLVDGKCRSEIPCPPGPVATPTPTPEEPGHHNKAWCEQLLRGEPGQKNPWDIEACNNQLNKGGVDDFIANVWAAISQLLSAWR